MDIQKIIASAYKSELGQQLDGIYSTSDGRIFIRKEEAVSHCEGQLVKNTRPLENKTVLLWFEEWSGRDTEPSYRSIQVWPDK